MLASAVPVINPPPPGKRNSGPEMQAARAVTSLHIAKIPIENGFDRQINILNLVTPVDESAVFVLSPGSGLG